LARCGQIFPTKIGDKFVVQWAGYIKSKIVILTTLFCSSPVHMMSECFMNLPTMVVQLFFGQIQLQIQSFSTRVPKNIFLDADDLL
jgi:hypothetical protein